MHPIRSTLVHKTIQPRKQSATGGAPALFMLHGRGANEDDLLGLSEYLDDRLFIISARAPYAFQYGSGFTWYDVLEVGKPDPKMFSESYRKLLQFLDDAKKGYPIDPTRMFFFGFSMGTMMSFAVALTCPELVRGVVANSGLIPEGTELKFKWNEIEGKPFFVAHGKYDPIIPVEFAHRAKELLQKAGANLFYREYEMGHQIDEESLNDIIHWMEKQLR
jgi:phospholipase/carboxylesterase